MTKNKPLMIGLVGFVLTALCCFTPILVILLGAIGMSSLVPALDVFLLPLLALFAVIIAAAIFKKARLWSS